MIFDAQNGDLFTYFYPAPFKALRHEESSLLNFSRDSLAELFGKSTIGKTSLWKVSQKIHSQLINHQSLIIKLIIKDSLWPLLVVIQIKDDEMFVLLLYGKMERFCNTVALIALVDTSIQSD